jgi:Mce-associated membrane protein
LADDADATGQLTAAAEEGYDEPEQPIVGDSEVLARQRVPSMRLAVGAGVILLVALGGLFGWLGWHAREARQAQQQREIFLQTGRQAAINLTTINAAEADADVQRVLASAAGTFHDDFAARAPAFVEVVKKAQSKTEGTVTAAALESESPDRARVMVAVSVKTSYAGAPEQQPRLWRMRIDVQKADDVAKVTNVVFVP